MRNRTSEQRIPRSDATETLRWARSITKFIYKHYAIDIADPSSMQDVCHMNFVIDLAHRGVSVAQW